MIFCSDFLPKGAVSDLHFVEINVKQPRTLTATTGDTVWSVMWVSVLQ